MSHHFIEFHFKILFLVKSSLEALLYNEIFPLHLVVSFFILDIFLFFDIVFMFTLSSKLLSCH